MGETYACQHCTPQANDRAHNTFVIHIDENLWPETGRWIASQIDNIVAQSYPRETLNWSVKPGMQM